MANPPPIVQTITVDTSQVTTALASMSQAADAATQAITKLGASAASALQPASSAADGFSTALTSLVSVAGSVVATIEGIKAAVASFAIATADGVKNLSDLAQEMGTTASEASALVGALSASGASTDSLGTAFKRLANSIGTDWPDIVNEIEAGADNIEKAALKVAEAITGIQTAQLTLSQSSARAGLAIEEASTNSAQAQLNASQSGARAVLAVDDAYQTLATSAENAGEATTKASSTMANDALNVQKADLAVVQAQHNIDEAAVELQFAWTNSYAKMRDDALSLADANLSVEEAEQRLRDLTSGTTDAAANKNLQIKRASLAVDQAQQKAAEASTKAQEDQAKSKLDIDTKQLTFDKAVLDLAVAKQAATDAAQKQQNDGTKTQLEISKTDLDLRKAQLDATKAGTQATIDQQKAAEAAQKTTLDLTKAINEAAISIQKAFDGAAKAQLEFSEASRAQSKTIREDLSNLVTEINNLTTGTGKLANGFELARVPVDKLAKAILAAQNQGDLASGLIKPTSLQALLNVSKVFQNIEDASTRTALAIKLFGRGAGPDLAEALHKGPEALQELIDKLKATGLIITDTEAKLGEELHNTFNQFGSDLTTAAEKLGLAFGPATLASVKALDDGLRELSQNGSLQKLGDVFASVAKAFNDGVKFIIDQFKALGAQIDKVAGEGAGLSVLRFVLGAIGTLLLLVISPFIAWPILVAAVTTAFGYLKEAWDSSGASIQKGIDIVTKFFSDKWNEAVKYVKDIFQSILDYISNSWVGTVLKTIAKVVDAIKNLFSSAKPDNAAGPSQDNTASPEGHATGGQIHGQPGHDKIPAMLTDKEFVVNAKDTARTLPLLHAINSGKNVLGFASGGYVGKRASSPSAPTGGSQRPVHLTIGSQTHKMSAPESVAKALITQAVRDKMVSTGRPPGWK